MLLMDLFKRKQNVKQNKHVEVEIEEKQNIDIIFRGYWDLCGTSELMIRNGAKFLIRDGYAKDMVDGIILYAKLGYDLKHLRTEENDDKLTIVLQGSDFYDYRV